MNFIVIGDHLDSTSLVTDASGNVLSEMRYKAWGEVRHASGSEVTKYQYTGQYSYASDFGLHFYNARWYDSSLSRFAQADSIIPNNIQGLDRYAYVNNSPVMYTDPSGHNPACGPDGIYCGGGNFTHPIQPTYVDPDKLTDSGKDGYKTYLKLFYDISGWWWSDPNLGGGGHFTVKDFVAMVWFEEGDSITQASYFDVWVETAVRSFYNWAKGQDARYKSGYAGLLNYTYAYTGAGFRTKPSDFDGGPGRLLGIPKMKAAVNAMLNPSSAGHPEWSVGCAPDRPCQMGSYNQDGKYKLPYIQTFRKNGCGPSFAVFPNCRAPDFVFFLTSDQANFWHNIKDEK